MQSKVLIKLFYGDVLTQCFRCCMALKRNSRPELIKILPGFNGKDMLIHNTDKWKVKNSFITTFHSLETRISFKVHNYYLFFYENLKFDQPLQN